MKLTVEKNGDKKIYEVKQGDNLLQKLAEFGYTLTAVCGGNGTCGKCKVKVLVGEFGDVSKDKNGNILSCKAKIISDASIEVYENVGGGLTHSNIEIKEIDVSTGYGIALDIGTTTLAFYLVNLENGKELEKYSCLNPQSVFGADVISRIKASAEGKLSLLFEAIRNKVNEVIARFKQKFKIEDISKLVVCGNTTMLNIFANEDVSGIGTYPFTAKFLGTNTYSGEDKGVDVKTVCLLPSISAYVGSDITAGAVATELLNPNKAELLLDIGTNGEMILNNYGKLYCVSTAAGPAFEGANITCGMGGLSGAIESVKFINGKIEVSTIGNIKAKGICGAGLIDAISLMKNLDIIDETGYLEDENGKYYLTDEVFISQKDIREFQLAKSSICSGLKVLIKKTGLKLEDIETLYIAGGLGFYIDKENSVNIGLIPRELKDKIQVVGNSGGQGAKICMLSKNKFKLCEEIASKTQNIELSNDEMFFDEYINNMYF